MLCIIILSGIKTTMILSLVMLRVKCLEFFDVMMLNVSMLSVMILNAITLNVIILNVSVLNVNIRMSL